MTEYARIGLMLLLVVQAGAGCSRKSAPGTLSSVVDTTQPGSWYTPEKGYHEMERYVLQGERTERGCRYVIAGSSKYPSDWTISSDDERCVQVRARGYAPVDTDGMQSLESRGRIVGAQRP